ncbi:universal stress protein [Putridiphycobacter roseus]|nr:universal stress protein [Putridiphycobacter roseus]
MKTILVPTDFSENAYKALEYASYLASQIGAKIVVLNSYQIPSGTSNVMINFADILEKDSKEDLAKLLDKLKNIEDFKGVEYIPFSCYGFLTQTIEIASKNHSIDLIVMGTTGASNIKNKIFGSNTLATIKVVDYPIVVVPQETQFSAWKNVILASNEDDSILAVAQKLNDIVGLENVNMDIVSVVPKNEQKADHATLILGLDGYNAQYSFHTEENDSVVEGVLNYTENHASNIIVLHKKSYSFLEGLMHSSVTKKLAMHSKKPLLII